MTFLELARKRQSTRKYSAKPVSRDALERCLEAARLAPSACNSQPLTFIVVDEENLKNKDYISMIAKGTADRLRPIILTTLTTVIGLVPLVYGLGGQSIYMGPMAMALAYGLLFATPLTIIIMPSLYLIGHDIKNVFSKKSKISSQS